jgi:hypothetical protein
MTTNRIGGPLPESNKPDPTKASGPQHKKVEKIEKIKETSETELNQQRKKFRGFVDESSEEHDPSLPPPPELFQSQGKTGSNKPQAKAPTEGVQKQDEDSGLPQSDDFWAHSGEPPDVILKEKTQLQEKTKHPGQKGTAVGASFGAVEPTVQMPKQQSTPSKVGKATSQNQSQIIPTHTPAQVKPMQPAKSTPEPIKTQISASPPPFTPPHKQTKPEGKTEPKQTGLAQGSPAPLPASKKGEKEAASKQSQSKQASIPIELPSQTPLPAAATNFAQNIAAPLAPYLSPQILPVFYQMVGTIFMMPSPNGDSLSEFVLNAPSFEKSQFYGAKITIERFSTAPDTFNIRLTGSNAAVAAFNQHIPSLMSAFQKGNFSFSIHRIEAAYEKLLFHRKKKADTGDLDNHFDGSEGPL